MADQLQLRGGTTAEHSTFTGALREVTVDTDKDTVVVHDGSTAGGHPLAKQNLSNVPAGTITSTMIADGTIVNADINASAAIDKTKISGTAITAGDTGTVTSTMIADGTIVNADVNASAAIAGTKISPDFGSQTIQTTGVVSHALGTAAAPTLTFTGDTNTGLYSPGADQVAISTNGTGRLFVDANGNVGVGIASPTQLLDVVGDADASIGPRFRNNNTGASAQSRLVLSSAGRDVSYAVNYAAQFASESGSNITTKYSSFDTHIWRNNAGSERLRITSDGKVGVGTSSPGTKLHIGGETNPVIRINTSENGDTWSTTSDYGKLQFFSQDYEYGGGGEMAAIAIGVNNVYGGTPNLRFYVSNPSGGAANPTERMRLDSSGRLGVGTTSPGSALHVVNATSKDQLRLGTATTEQYQIGRDASSGLLWFYGTQTGYTGYVFDGVNGERMRIDSSGRVGIGTSSPSSQLDVRGSATSFDGLRIINTNSSGAAATTSAIRLGITNSIGIRNARIEAVEEAADSNRVSLDFYTNAANALDSENFGMRLDGSGRLGIGTASPSYALDVQGSQGVGLQIFENSSGNNRRLRVTQESSGVTYDATYSATGNNHRWLIGGGETMRLDQSGRLLVGTTVTSLTSKLNIKGRSDDANGNAGLGLLRGSAVSAADQSLGGVFFLDANENYGASIYSQSEASWTSGSSHPTRLVFTTAASGAANPTERLRIDNRGQSQFTCNTGYINVATFSSSATSGQQYGIGITTANDQNDTTRTFFECYGAATLRAAFRSNGGLANYSANNANLSDRNAKKDITPAADTWDCIKEWEIVNYRYKDQPDDADLNLGVIAQQVAESCPEVITVFSEETEDQPEKLGVKEQQMYWMAIKALQEAQVRIEALEAEVAALKAQ